MLSNWDIFGMLVGGLLLFIVIPLLFGMLIASVVGAVGVDYYWVVFSVLVLCLFSIGLFYYLI